MKISKAKYLLFKRGIKFIVRGLAGTVVDTLILWLLTAYLFRSYFTTYILSPSISFEIAMLNNYIICYFWIWNHRVQHNKKDFFRRIPTYNAAALISFGVKMALLLTVERIFHFNVIICNLIALCFSGFVNFFASEKIIFKEETPIIKGCSDDGNLGTNL
jgi:putative flippase GtrA